MPTIPSPTMTSFLDVTAGINNRGVLEEMIRVELRKVQGNGKRTALIFTVNFSHTVQERRIDFLIFTAII